MIIKKLTRIYTRLSIFNWLLPSCCIVCGYYTQNSKNICTRCQCDLPSVPQSCLQCGRFLYGNMSLIKCGDCLNNPPAFDLTYALFPYQWPIIPFILKLKFQHQLCYAQALGELLGEKISNAWYTQNSLPDLILPIPLHPHRLRERGFNQALEIARPIARSLNINIDITGIKRIKSTGLQSSLPATKRKQNIANAFAAYRNYSGLKIAILDDVVTTGHTVMECSRLLKKQGAAHIDVWCCARRG